eukprot:1078263-Prorocentrum_minimum.AAC.1
MNADEFGCFRMNADGFGWIRMNADGFAGVRIRMGALPARLAGGTRGPPRGPPPPAGAGAPRGLPRNRRPRLGRGRRQGTPARLPPVGAADARAGRGPRGALLGAHAGAVGGVLPGGDALPRQAQLGGVLRGGARAHGEHGPDWSAPRVGRTRTASMAAALARHEGHATMEAFAHAVSDLTFPELRFKEHMDAIRGALGDGDKARARAAHKEV